MKKILFLLSFVFVCQNQLTAQIISPVVDTYNIKVIRDDMYNPSEAGYAGSNATLYIKIGSNTRHDTFNANAVTEKTYNFPITYVLAGTPPPTRYVKVIFTSPSLYSGYYPLTTTVGDHTTIPSEPTMIYSNLFGYAVDITCIAPNQYNMKVTRFECYFCGPTGNTVSKQAASQPKTAIVSNQDMGISELYYTAADKETVSVSVVDLNGKTVRAYTTDVRAGQNKLPIDLQNYPGGTYLVKWTSSTGANGTLKMMKNK